MGFAIFYLAKEDIFSCLESQNELLSLYWEIKWEIAFLLF